MEANMDFAQQAIRDNVRGAKGWLKFLGIMSIIGGAVYALTLIGIVVAWLPIWLGVLMYQAGSRAQEFAERGDVGALSAYTAKLKTLFTLMGILTIISLVLGIVGAIISVAMGIFAGGLPALLEQYGYS
ncbi:MAG: hypothetical protein JSU73_06385 [candidate division WOR-3 bacterium]|nr:MAG: hypothetical protein JSU73_06385 [candidate division WOR-3 bacterium]